MSVRQTLRLKELASAAGVATASTLVMGLSLAWISTPPNFKARSDAVAAQANQVRDLIRVAPADHLYAPDAICRREAGAAAKTLRDSVSAAAAQANLSLDFLEVHPEPASEAPAALEPVRLKFTVTGAYENVVALLAAIGRQRPDVFVDGVDLTAKTANVTANFSGRAFCAA